MRRLQTLILLSASLVPLQQHAQQPYSQSPEFQSMLQELKKPAPSPAFIATGHLPQADANLKVDVEDTAQALNLSTSAAFFSLSKTNVDLTWQNSLTHASWTLSTAASCDKGSASVANSARSGNAWTVSVISPCGPSTFKLELLTASLARLTLDGGAAPELQLHAATTSQLFGLGERFWQAGLSGTNLDVRPQDRYGEPGHNWTYVAIPFVYGTQGLGLYADTAFDTKFAFNAAGTAFDVHIASHPVPIYLFSEPSPKAVLSAYTGVTGRPQMPPQWTFGPWVTTLGGKGAVLNDAQRLRLDHVPASALWVFDELDEHNNLGWPFWFGSYYGDARTFSNTLHGLGFKILTYVHPYVREAMFPYPVPSPMYEKGVKEHLLAMGADGLPAGPKFELVQAGNVDFTNPAAVDWWQGMITAAVRDQGIDGWMEDFGEWVRDSDTFYAGTGKTISELYPLLYHKLTIRAAQAVNPDVAPFSRSGSPGSQAFSPVLWGADQWPDYSRDYGLPSVVTAGITASMSGFSTWGPDILSTGADRELWQRWVEFGALVPVMRDHVWNKPDRTYNLFTDDQTTAFFRRYGQLHSSLLPYFTYFAEEAHRTGVPIMRHLALEFPDDPHAALVEYQYMLGDRILVAPVVAGGQSLRTLYLPKGEWVNFWAGASLFGGQDVTIPSPPDQIPMLVKAGSILPFKPERDAASWDWNDPHLLDTALVWRAYLSETGKAEGSFTLSNGTGGHLTQAAGTATIEGQSKTIRDYEVIVRTVQPPKQVLLNGTPMPVYTPGVAGARASQWYWNPSGFELHLLFHAADFRLDLKGVSAEQYQN
jgi:alpha-glucosidase (family GH31 glycosyl hydrolase)